MSEAMQKELLARIDALAAKLGVAAKYLFALYVRQATIDGWECVAGAVLSAIVGYYSVRYVRAYSKYPDYDKEMLALGAAVLAIGSIVVGSTCVFNGADLLSNPQLWAFKEIMSTLK